MSPQNRVRKLINLEIQKEKISKRENGKCVGDVSAEYGMANSTISSNFIVYGFYYRKFVHSFHKGKFVYYFPIYMYSVHNFNKVTF